MSKATILIVEDDAILAMYLQEIITLMGYTAAKPLASGEEALVFLADNPVDLVLMDIELAGRLNGINTAEAISRTSDVPIIFLTGYSHDPLLEQAKIAAPYGYLIKPVPERELAATLSMALHRYALNKQLKESRIALARSEARYRHLFENSPLGIFRTTLEGKPLALNAEMARIVGCATPEEAIAEFKDLAKNLYVDPERRQEFIRQLQDNGSVQHFVYEGRKKTGETIWISMNAKLTAADEGNGEQSDPVIDGFAVDITDTKRAEEALRESEEQFRSLAESSRDYIMRYDRACRHTYMNPAGLDVSGMTAADIIGKTHQEAGFSPEQSRFWEEKITEVFTTAQPYQTEFSWQSAHGLAYLDWRLTPEFTPEGKVHSVLGVSRDITERKRAEMALRESEETHRALVEGLPDVVMRFDKEGRHLFVSENIREVVDLPAADFIGKTHRQLGFPEKLCTTWEESIRRVFASGKPFEGESKFKGKWGSVIHNWRLVPEFDAQKQIQSVLMLSRNITAHRQAEQDYQTLFNEMLDGFALHQIICDEKGMPVDYRFLAINPAFERITGLKAADIIGHTVLEILPGIEPHWIERYGHVALNGEPAHFENFSTDLGKYFEITAFQPAPDQFACIFVDITNRKKAELELQSKETYLRTLFDESPMGISSSRDGIMLNANKKYLRMFGYKNVSELQGESLLEHIAPQCRKEMADRIARRARGEQVETVYETVGQRKDGSQFPFMVSVDRINLQEGLITFSFLTDITDRKRAEAEHKQLQAQLQQAQKMEAIGTLAGGIAHDFNNILGAILGYAEMALDDCPAGSMAANDVGQVIKAGHRARELVKQILAFSRQAETEHMPLQPASIIKEAIKMLRSSLPSTITIEQDIDKDAGPLFADPTQIHQILMNLCTNAFHAMETTGGILSISLKEKNLSRQDFANEPQAEPGNFVHLSVSDTGAGIPPEIRERIFDPYFTTKETGKGTGMGLSIVHGIVKSYGGFISCLSEPGKGTMFQVFLPVMTEINLPAEMAEEPLQLGNERILFIDDEEMLVEMGRNLLERLGYRVTVRTNSLDALTTFQNQPDQFDLVITDQTMPGMTGSDLARRMLQIRPDLPIILCTGFSNLISAEKARSLGIKGFALKPLAKKDVATLIRKVLDDGMLVGSKV